MVTSAPVTVINIVLGVKQSKFVDPGGGFATKLMGGVAAVGTGPAVARVKSPGVGTPPAVPYASTIL